MCISHLLDVDGESVSDVALDCTVVGLVDVVGLDHLHVGVDLVLRAEIKHLLSLLNAADEGANEGLPAENDTKGGDGKGRRRGTNKDELTVGSNGGQERIDVVVGADGVHNTVELLSDSHHCLRVSRVNEIVGSELGHGFLFLGSTAGQDSHVATKSDGELHSHGAETTEAGDGHMHALLNAVVDERRVDGDASAEEGGSLLKRDALVNLADVILVDNDVLGVATVSGSTFVGLLLVARAVRVFFAPVVGANHTSLAVLLGTLLALITVAARVDEAADTSVVTNLELGDVLADGDDHTGDLVSRDHREDSGAPLLAGLMDVGVADASVGSLNVHIVVTNVAALDRVGLELAASSHGCVSFDVETGLNHRIDMRLKD